jgi:hypothetical protein
VQTYAIDFAPFAIDGVGFVAGLAKLAEDGTGRTATRAGHTHDRYTLLRQEPFL